MHRQKGTPNIPQAIKEEIVRKHTEGISVRELAEAYDKSYKTIKGLLYRERLKKTRGLSSEATRAQTSKDTAGIQIRKQAAENGSGVTAGFSLAHWKGVKASVKYKVI